jgi:hypothetical protein
MKSIKLLSLLFILILVACSDDNEMELENMTENKTLEELIIGTWYVYDIKVLDKNKVEIALPGFISIECDSQTRYTFLNEGDFILENRTSWQEEYNQQGEIIGGQCNPNLEGGGFDNGNWTVKIDENKLEFLDIDWIYKRGSEDGVLWSPEFITDKTFVISDYHEYDEEYYLYYYKK